MQKKPNKNLKMQKFGKKTLEMFNFDKENNEKFLHFRGKRVTSITAPICNLLLYLLSYLSLARPSARVWSWLCTLNCASVQQGTNTQTPF